MFMAGIKAKANACDDDSDTISDAFADLHKTLLTMSVDKFFAEHFDQYEKFVTWELERTFKFRRCLLSGKVLLPGTQVYKGTIDYNGRCRTYWLAPSVFLMKFLKKDFNKGD